jgi:hypothetical protein
MSTLLTGYNLVERPEEAIGIQICGGAKSKGNCADHRPV